MNTLHRRPQTIHAQGFALIEVMVTIIVLAVGLLGMARLQADGIGYNTGSLQRSVAAQQAYDMADRIRANPDGVTLGAYNSLSGSGTNPSCISSGCTPQQLAQYDFYIWNQENASLLPSGSGRVSGSNGVFTVIVNWDPDRTGASNSATDCTARAANQQKCYQLKVRTQ